MVLDSACCHWPWHTSSDQSLVQAMRCFDVQQKQVNVPAALLMPAVCDRVLTWLTGGAVQCLLTPIIAQAISKFGGQAMLSFSMSQRQANTLLVLTIAGVCYRVLTQLTDGKWVFQVQAVATSGATGAAVSFPFLVDSTPPTITTFIVGYTANKQAVNRSLDAAGGSVTVPSKAFDVYMTYSDGLLGSGVSVNG